MSTRYSAEVRQNSNMESKEKPFTTVDLRNISERIAKLTKDIGLETYFFKVGWYNDAVNERFHLPYSPDTLACVVLSVPEMFEKCLIPFIKDDNYDCLSSQDPLDQCMKDVFGNIKKELCEYSIECIHDYEVHPNRRPKLLVQTAGHVSGAAYYYRQEELKGCPSDKKLYGVSIHPKYGGWFAFRGALIFKGISCPFLEQKAPADVLETDELKLELLKRFNYNWKDWSYRDIIVTKARYSEEQKQFFITPPAERKELIRKLLNQSE